MNLTYDDQIIEVKQRTESPCSMVAFACALTQKEKALYGSYDSGIFKFLLNANHTSPFEHASITLFIQNVSRSFLAQITTHRMSSITSSSQHYQKYDGYPNVFDEDMSTLNSVKQLCGKINNEYRHLLSINIDKEEARQILPNAKAVNLLWTVNARSLINFFNQRLCKRNVQEMYLFAKKLQVECIRWFPELFKLVGPDCKTLGGCTQGHMKSQECKDAKIPDFKR